MKALFASILVLTFTTSLAFAQDLEGQWQGGGMGRGKQMKNLSPEERHAKMQEVYNNATPEEKARMDAKRKLNQDKATELGLDLNTAEGRAAFQAYRQQNRGSGQGMGKGKGQGQGQGKGKGRHGN